MTSNISIVLDFIFSPDEFVSSSLTKSPLKCWIFLPTLKEKQTLQRILRNTSTSANSTTFDVDSLLEKGLSLSKSEDVNKVSLNGIGQSSNSKSTNQVGSEVQGNSILWRNLEISCCLPEDLVVQSKKMELDECIDVVIAVNSLFTMEDYKGFIIRVNKLLKIDGKFVSMDFYLDFDRIEATSNVARVEDFAPEMQLLNTMFKYKVRTSNNESNLERKLDKYLYHNTKFVDASCIFLKNLDESSALFQQLNSGRLKFCRLIADKKASSEGAAVLEPRIRDKDGFRQRAGAVIYKRSSSSTTLSAVEVLFLKRRSDGWTLPGGGVEKNESIEAAVIRECFEECGIVGKSTGYYGIVQDPSRKTKTNVFLVEAVEEKDEYPENDREKKWIGFEELTHHYQSLETTKFFGEENITSESMLKLVWKDLTQLS